jgi:hypothetical protein
VDRRRVGTLPIRATAARLRKEKRSCWQQLAGKIGKTGAGSNRTEGIRTGRGKKLLEALAAREVAHRRSASGPILARVGLPGGDAIGITATQCGLARTSCYELAEYWEEPARYVRATHGEKRGRVKRIVGCWLEISDGGSAGRSTVLDMAARHGCAGVRQHEHPYAFAYGLLRGVKDVVSDRTNGRTIGLKTAPIPGRMHREGVLVYGLLPPGSNDVVVRAPGGRIVSQERRAGADEGVSCGDGRR